MTIQLPILLWTIISFCILMLVLDRLLFRPLLAFMDARRAKIDRAHMALEAAGKARADALQAAEEARLAAAKRARDDAQAALERAHDLAALQAEKQEQAYAARLAEAKARMDAEKLAIRRELDGGMDDFVAAFAEKLAL